MHKKYPIETLLRPIHEFTVVNVGLAVITLLTINHNIFLLSFETALMISLFIFVLIYVRFNQGYKVRRYQKGLIKLSFYILKPKKIPTNKNYLFLGKGFKWEQVHTQRLEDLKDSKNSKYLKAGRIYRLIREKEKTIRVLYFLFHTSFFLNPFKPLPPVGGKPEIHAVGMVEGEKDVYESLGERVGHKLVLGTTRVGKTRLAEILITQDIRRGDVTIVFDPKGDADLMYRCYVEAKKANRPVYVLHLGFPEISCRYNAVGSFNKITEVAGRISDQLPAEGNSAVFRDFAWGFINIVARALVKAGEKPNYPKIKRYVNNIDPLIKLYTEKVLYKSEADSERVINEISKTLDPNKLRGKDKFCSAVAKYVADYNINDEDLEGILTVFKYDQAYYSKLIASLRPLLDKLTSGKVAELLAPSDDINDKRPIIDWMTVIRQKAVVYIGLDALTDSVVAGAVGASMFADLTSVAGEIYKHGISQGMPELGPHKLPLSIHADEFNELIGDQFIPMINKAGGAGFQVTAYTQSGADVESGIGSKAKANVIFDNFNTMIMLRPKSAETAELLTSKVPEYKTKILATMSQSSGSPTPGDDIDFTAAARDQFTTEKTPAISIADILSLPKGQAFALIEGGQLHKLRFPLAGKEEFKKGKNQIPQNLKTMMNEMSKQYQSEYENLNSKKIAA